MPSQAAGDYLKVIYKLQSGEQRATTSAIAERLGVVPASVTNMVKQLSQMNLVEHTPYRGVELTPLGRKVALEVIRHHRLIELYLTEVLGFSWDKVDAEAERLEHVISEELEDRMADALGHPTHDPHGDPIPTKEGDIDTAIHDALADLEPGQSAVVQRVSDADPDLLRYLASLGLVPRATVEMLDKAPFGGPLTIRVGGTQHAVGRELASSIRVRPS
ncbi:MAG: metal-dependent transcriptional regulator [Chloroflexi bacterium]|nr:metal-dependent transcriptional regulator [Chloroflexota bacterium]